MEASAPRATTTTAIDTTTIETAEAPAPAPAPPTEKPAPSESPPAQAITSGVTAEAQAALASLHAIERSARVVAADAAKLVGTAHHALHSVSLFSVAHTDRHLRQPTCACCRSLQMTLNTAEYMSVYRDTAQHAAEAVSVSVTQGRSFISRRAPPPMTVAVSAGAVQAGHPPPRRPLAGASSWTRRWPRWRCWRGRWRRSRRVSRSSKPPSRREADHKASQSISVPQQRCAALFFSAVLRAARRGARLSAVRCDASSHDGHRTICSRMPPTAQAAASSASACGLWAASSLTQLLPPAPRLPGAPALSDCENVDLAARAFVSIGTRSSP